ncbi:N-glycosylase/DNA lyase [Mycena chlorophos]|uniref:DNA-(apurinic or apyrimidinic site) lyase n=1 Tax=Mycena chlorophos TaxID=658473 RepID=A0A8H6WMV5_MYCCL|nr:N-glycosylase/DNA lyase [Mycena chlorophos]
MSLVWLSLPIAKSRLNLSAVLPSGQSFRWNIDGQTYSFCLGDRVVFLKQDADKLYYRTTLPQPFTRERLCAAEAETASWINDYFNLHVDIDALYARWQARDTAFARISTRFAGIRILRQDPFENLISFMCSSNNHVSRISSMVKKLCTNFSPCLLSEDGVEYHPFPTPQALSAPGVEKTLRDLGFGYRAKFIQKTAEMLVEAHGDAVHKFLAGLRVAETDVAREELLKFLGVGRKVADCVLLMSLDKHNVVPVDTHVYQIAVKRYKFKGSAKATMTPKLYAEVNAHLVDVWGGEYAGWAQSVLFVSDLKAFSAYDAAAGEGSTVQPSTPAKRKGDEITSPPTTKRRRSRS